jgi:hypothetical protein
VNVCDTFKQKGFANEPRESRNRLLTFDHSVVSNTPKALSKPTPKGLEVKSKVEKRKEVRPEQIIPLKEGEFNEF